MKRFTLVSMFLLMISLLTGCIGEKYDFSPPTLAFYNGVIEYNLIEANVKWNLDADQYNKENEDLQKVADTKEQMYFSPGQVVDYELKDGTFDSAEIDVKVMQNDMEQPLSVNASLQEIQMPSEKGMYLLIANISTSRGTAQYVYNLEIK